MGLRDRDERHREAGESFDCRESGQVDELMSRFGPGAQQVLTLSRRRGQSDLQGASTLGDSTPDTSRQ